MSPELRDAQQAHTLGPSVRLGACRLHEGKLVAFPTETVYGLGARVGDEAALARIFAAKGRPATHPLVLHVSSIAMARDLVTNWPDAAEALARAFWPGPLTLILPRGARVPDIVTGGGPTVAIRMPAHPVALALIEATGEAIAAPSANPYQGISPTTAAHVVQGLGDKVDLIVDGGPCARGLESTIVDVTGQRLLRLGPVSPSALYTYLPELRLQTQAAPDHAASPHEAPGLSAKHYAPRATLRVLARCDLPTRGAAQTPVLAHSFDPAFGLRLPGDAEGYGATLYAALHTLDRPEAHQILVEQIPEGEAWLAVADRLARAAH